MNARKQPHRLLRIIGIAFITAIVNNIVVNIGVITTFLWSGIIHIKLNLQIVEHDSHSLPFWLGVLTASFISFLFFNFIFTKRRRTQKEYDARKQHNSWSSGWQSQERSQQPSTSSWGSSNPNAWGSQQPSTSSWGSSSPNAWGN